MAQLYRITPVDKKSVELFIDVFERLPDGTVRGFDVTEIYRWGQGFREMDNEVWEYEANGSVSCDPEIGWGCELDDLCGVYLNFTDGFTEEEKEEIEALCRGDQEDEEGRWGQSWIFDGDHNWEIEDYQVNIIGPVKIDIVDEEKYNVVIEENIQPYKHQE